jgi:geranyl-CoA carboxylase beta subunit
MTVFQSAWNAEGAVALQRREAMLTRIAALRALEERSAAASAKSRPAFDKRGQLLPRERVALLLDPGALPRPLVLPRGLSARQQGRGAVGAGRRHGGRHRLCERCALHGGGQRLGHRGRRHPGHGAGKDSARAGDRAANKLPFIHLVESAGANLMRYRVEGFVHGGSLFRNLARLSAAGIPVITVQHGSGTAGGAYMPGLSDVVIMVRKRSRAFLAGPPLLMAATGEVATEEELGGAEMHTACRGWASNWPTMTARRWGLAREVVARTSWSNRPPAQAGHGSNSY